MCTPVHALKSTSDQILNNFWYFKHQTSTMIWSEAYMKHNWRFVFEKRKKKLTKTISSIMFQMFLSLVKVWNIKNYLKLWLEVVDIRACPQNCHLSFNSTYSVPPQPEHILFTENKQKLPFSKPPPPLQQLT